MSMHQAIRKRQTYRAPFVIVPLSFASLGELIPFALLNLGTAGVSKVDLRLVDPLPER